MAEAVEVAIEMALLDVLTDWAALQSPVITIAQPNIAFTPPSPLKTAKWLRATHLPVPTGTIAVGTGSNEHQGILQVDAVMAQGVGDPTVLRLAADIIALFKRGTTATKDGFTARIWKAPYRGPLIKDDPWVFVPVSIRYIAFATDPA